MDDNSLNLAKEDAYNEMNTILSKINEKGIVSDDDVEQVKMIVKSYEKSINQAQNKEKLNRISKDIKEFIQILSYNNDTESISKFVTKKAKGRNCLSDANKQRIGYKEPQKEIGKKSHQKVSVKNSAQVNGKDSKKGFLNLLADGIFRSLKKGMDASARAQNKTNEELFQTALRNGSDWDKVAAQAELRRRNSK